VVVVDKRTSPTVGVIVVNYQGGELTLRCLESLQALEWPRDRLRIVLVDNASGDGVLEEVERRWTDVLTIASPSNVGFATGCNLGIRRLADADYIGLVNNDAFVDPAWLQHLVAVLEGNPAVGAASSKVLFATPFVELQLETSTSVLGRGDRRPLGVHLSGSRVDGKDVWRRTQLVRGFWGGERRRGAPDGQWSSDRALLRVPSGTDGGSAAACELRLAAGGEKSVVVACGSDKHELAVGRTPTWYEIPLVGPAVDVLNSTGVLLLEGGYGADRGFLEVDEGQYDEPAEVFAWSGAAVLLSKRYLEAVGLFDDRFFLYYEDFDLSWRGRLAGWRYMYEPGSVAQHVHSAATGQASPLQQHYVERNRLLTLTRCAPRRVVLGALLRFVLVTMSYLRRDALSRAARAEAPSFGTVLRRGRAFAAYLVRLPVTLSDRRRIRRARTVGDAEILGWMVPAPGPVLGTKQ
jgi:GT2 family glycosyltransferase